MRTVQHVRSPQERGGLWKRERERKPLGGERISIVRCALSPLKEVVARTAVDGSCVTRTVNQIKSHASPQDSGRTLLRGWRTQSIRERTRGTGHQRKNATAYPQHAEHQRQAQKRWSQKEIPQKPHCPATESPCIFSWNIVE